jgi:hypothetical protein
LRSRHSDASYLGIELEVNQHFVTRGGAAWRTLRSALAVSLTKALAATPGATA